MDTRQGTIYFFFFCEGKDLTMIKHTVYSERVEATYSEGDSWYETIAEYFKKHTNFEEHVIDNIVEDVYIKRYNSGMKFMGTAKYNNPSDIKRAEKISTERLKEKYSRLMYAVLNKIVAYYEQDIIGCLWRMSR